MNNSLELARTQVALTRLHACVELRLALPTRIVTGKLLLWSVCERYRFEIFSSHDAVTYYAKMIGVSRRTAGRAMKELIEKEVLWCVLEGKEGRLRVSQARGIGLKLLVRMMQ